MSRDLLSAVGGLSENPQLVAAEDFECWLRLARRTERFAKLPGEHGYYWIGKGNTSSPTRTITWLNELRAIYMHQESLSRLTEPPAWLAFALGKAHFQLRQNQQALQELSNIHISKNNIVSYIKKTILNLAIRIHLHRRNEI